jgi:hypothetical protein
VKIIHDDIAPIACVIPGLTRDPRFSGTVAMAGVVRPVDGLWNGTRGFMRIRKRHHDKSKKKCKGMILKGLTQ